MMRDFDLVVIGAGPAGISGAITAANEGLSVLLLDEQPRAGGQIYRNVERTNQSRSEILGSDYTKGLGLVQSLNRADIEHIHGANVWQIENQNTVYYSVNGTASVCRAKCILLATGAIERPMPVPGWTLPGVMTAGAAQILLKQSGIVCENAVIAGSGPLLYLVAAQMVRAGTPPLALLETQTKTDFLASMRYVKGALRGASYLAKGLSLLAEIRKARVPRYVGVTDIAIDGHDKVEGISFNDGRKKHTIPCGTALLHHGVVPNTQAARSVGVKHQWNDQQHCFVPEVDLWGRTASDGIYVAGDGAGIGGANVAALTGELAALDIARTLGALSESERDKKAAPITKKRNRELAARPFIDRAYPPYANALAPEDSTIICRCEEVTAGDIRQYAKLGCIGPNQTKAFGRSGMGPCQGRYCGLAVTEILAAENQMSPDQTGYYRIRPPIKPVTLGELVGLELTEEKESAE